MRELERRRFYLEKDVMRTLEVYAEIRGVSVSMALEEILKELFSTVEKVSLVSG